MVSDSRDLRLGRVNDLIKLTGVDKSDFCEKTGFSEDQYYSWMAPSNAARARSPSLAQLQVITEKMDWSPTYIFHGIGKKLLSEIRDTVAIGSMTRKELIDYDDSRGKVILDQFRQVTALLNKILANQGEDY